MAVTIQNVRDFLGGLSDKRVSDAAITLQLQIADTKVNAAKSATASTQQLDDAKLAVASHLTMLSYASVLERSLGAVPAPIISHLSALKILAVQLIEIIKRGAPTYTPMNEQWDTLVKQYIDGDLSDTEDWY